MSASVTHVLTGHQILPQARFLPAALKGNSNLPALLGVCWGDGEGGEVESEEGEGGPVRPQLF